MKFRGAPLVDRGWAWLVVLSAFMHLFILIGLAKSSGIIFVELIERYHGSASSASVMVALQTGISLFFAPVITAAVEMFNCRLVCFVGGVLFASAFLIASFLDSLEKIVISFGILAGFGYGCCLTPTPVIVGRYFDKKRSLANGLAFSGTGLGNVVLPILVYHLIDKYYLHGAMLILGAFSLQTLVFASLYRPLSPYQPASSKKTLHNKSPAQLLNIAHKEKTRNSGHKFLTTQERVVNHSATLQQPISETTENRATTTAEINTSEFTESIDGKKQSTKFIHKTDCAMVKAPGDATTVSHRDKTSNNVDIDKIGEIGAFNENNNNNNNNNGEDDGDVNSDQRSPYESVLDMTMISSFQDIPRSLAGLDSMIKETERDGGESPIIAGGNKLKVSDDEPGQRWIKNFAVKICYVDDENGKRNHVLSVELLKNREYLFFMLGVVLFLNAFFTSIIVPPHCVDLNFSKADAALMLSIQGGADMSGRLFTAFIGDRAFFRSRRRSALTLYAALVACSLFALSMLRTFYAFSAVLIFCSFIFGAFVALNPVVVTDIVGVNRLAGAWGLQLFFEGFTLTVSPLAMGALRDSTGSYRACFYYTSASCALAAVSIAAATFRFGRGDGGGSAVTKRRRN